MQRREQPSIEGRILHFSKADLEGVFLEAKWINDESFPEIGSYIFIDSQVSSESIVRTAWLSRITGYRRTGILGDTASEMLLTYKDLDVSSLKSEIYEKVIILEVLTSLKISEGVVNIESDLNILPTYGDTLVQCLSKNSLQCDPSDVLQALLRGNSKIELKQIGTRTKGLTWKDVAESIDLKNKRSVIFGKTGTGKTVLSIDLLKSYAIKENRPVIVFDVQGEFCLGNDPQKSIFFGNTQEETQYLQEKVVIFSNRSQASPEITSRVVGPTKIDLREIGFSKAVKVMCGLTSEDRNNQWYSVLDNETLNNGFDEQLESRKPSFSYPTGSKTDRKNVPDGTQDVSLTLEYLMHTSYGALVRHAYEVVNNYHQKENPLLLKLKYFLEKNSIIVFDLADCPIDHQERLIETVVNELLEYNRDEYVMSSKKTLKPLVVIDEAQLFFAKKLDDQHPVVRLFKEGRKFDLSVLMMTQQPSSMPENVLSQVENIFTYTMTSAVDISTLARINKGFNHGIQYQIDTNRKKWSPFVVTDRLPFAIQFDAGKGEGKPQKIFTIDKYAEFEAAFQKALSSGKKDKLTEEDEHCWYKKTSTVKTVQGRVVFDTKIDFCRYIQTLKK